MDKIVRKMAVKVNLDQTDFKFEARNPKLETISNEQNSNVRNKNVLKV